MKTEKRDQIMDAALTLFVEQGFQGTSTAQIAKTAGVATGTLFHHFATKEDLINALYLNTKTKLVDYLKDQLKTAEGHREKLHVIWMGIVRWSLENEREYRFFKHCDASPYIGQSLREECEAKFSVVVEVFQKAISAEVIRDLPIEFMMYLTHGLMEGFIRYIRLNPEMAGNQELWEQAEAMTWDAIR